MFARFVNLPEKQSFFLFGARGTGKATLLRQRFAPQSSHFINLLLAKNEDLYSREPDRLIAEVNALPERQSTIVIDEIQKVPKLLDVVHELIETTSRRFVLTGSSARKLRHGSANMLAGRAVQRFLFPLTNQELTDTFDLDLALRWGTLPAIFSLQQDQEKADFLIAYAQVYLKEEIWSEHLIRKLDPFRKFLEIAAQMNGKQINFSGIARQCGADTKTIKNYYQILEDTLVGFFLESYSPSVRKAIKQAPKFYFFDVGVSRAIARQLEVPPMPSTSYFGELFEQFVITEIYRAVAYSQKQIKMSFLRTQAGNEVDIILDRPGRKPCLIEIKSTNEIRPEQTKPMLRFVDEFPDAMYYIFSLDPTPQKIDRIRVLPWHMGIEEVLS